MAWLPVLAFLGYNLFAFLLMGWDKRNAGRGGRRIPEARLFAVAFMLGASGIFAGMKAFRHKTRHRSFAFGIPLLFVWNAAAILLICRMVPNPP